LKDNRELEQDKRNYGDSNCILHIGQCRYIFFKSFRTCSETMLQ